jgi:DNA modification methylase
VSESFLDGKVTLHRGDCIEVLPLLEANSIDSCVTDPPYHLTSIVKRFGSQTAAPAQYGADGAYARASKGFMGKQWDGGDVAFRPEIWVEVLRVLKPGAHLIAFSGTRTYHRMACAIEDAGFEIRDQIGWCYGSGFPKSHDVSKGIDKRGGKYVGWFGPWLRRWRIENNIAQKDIAALFPSKTGGKTGCVANWELGLNMPTPEQFNAICAAFDLPFASLEEAEREIIGQRTTGIGTGNGSVRVMGDGGRDLTSPATAAALQWQGWGTALKPAWEPIVLARKPLSESSIAANVLKHGPGGINVDGCRVGTGGQLQWEGPRGMGYHGGSDAGSVAALENAKGRWPANLIHDGSEEVLAGFPETGLSAGGRIGNAKGAYTGLGEAGFTTDHIKGDPGFGDSGSAARFFYTAKADADDRLGSKHPTVKPLDLIQYLVRLVTPKGGIVLDPFAGTGTLGEAAFREAASAILIEREEEYQDDIVKRMGLCLSGPDTRKAASTKQLPPDDLPMFGGGI